MIKRLVKRILKKQFSLIEFYKMEIQDREFEDFISSLKKNEDYYYTYAKRPINVDEVEYRTKAFSSEKIGIVIQGPLKIEDHFTLQTVKLYRTLYPKCPIIVSTWQNEEKKELDSIKRIGNTFIVKSDYPMISGHGHINYQRISSMNGILKAKELGCEFVLKSRTDQRLYANNVICYFKDLVERFPLKIKCSARGRIAVCSLSTLKDRLYNICDMLLFGYTEDMLRYFSPLEAPDFPEGTELPSELDNPIDYAKFRPGEIFFATNYIENCGFKLKWTFEDSDFYRNNLFVVFNSESVDQFWPKYGSKEYLWRSYNSIPHEMATFEDWLINQGETSNND